MDVEAQKHDLLDGPKEILKLPLKWHQYFDQNIWQKEKTRPSFHNKEHLQSVLNAGLLYLNSIDPQQDDPLRVNESIKNWNQTYPDFQIDKEYLKFAFEWAAYYHDTGNLMGGLRNEDGRLVPQYFKIYRAGKHKVGGFLTAEQRSEEIARVAIQSADIFTEAQERLSDLVAHLIAETDHEVRINRPFALFMRTTDQIGNSLLNDQEDNEEGLLIEFLTEDPEYCAVLYKFINFYNIRFDQLIPDRRAQEEIYAIWKSERPEYIEGLSKKEVPGQELLAYVRGEINSV